MRILLIIYFLIISIKKKNKLNNRRNRILKIMEKQSNRHVIDESFVLGDRDASGAPFQ